MAKRVEIELPQKLYEQILSKIEGGEFATVSEFIRTAIRKMLGQ